jgi:tetratricopeptide (TPR) repeat protein
MVSLSCIDPRMSCTSSNSVITACIQGIAYFDKALAIDPNNEVALTGKGQSLDNLGNYTQAIPYIDKALAIDPNDKFALIGKGESYNGLGNYTQAIQYYDKALAIDPNIKEALTGKGDALSALGNNTLAIKYYDKALAIDPNFKDALDNKQAALSKMGQQQPQQQQTINESRVGPAPSSSPYAVFNSSGLICHYNSHSGNMYCAMRR